MKEEELPNTYIVGSPPAQAQPEGDEKGMKLNYLDKI